jgi:hypothetical protein
MTSIIASAKEFFDACETGKGWEGARHCLRWDRSRRSLDQA